MKTLILVSSLITVLLCIPAVSANEMSLSAVPYSIVTLLKSYDQIYFKGVLQ